MKKGFSLPQLHGFPAAGHGRSVWLSNICCLTAGDNTMITILPYSEKAVEYFTAGYENGLGVNKDPAAAREWRDQYAAAMEGWE